MRLLLDENFHLALYRRLRDAGQDVEHVINNLRAVGLESLTAEAIVLDYPDLFDPKAVAVARKRLAR